MLYHVSRNGQNYGPYTLEDLQRYVTSGNVLPTDMAKSDEMTEWVPVSQVLGGAGLGGVPASMPGGMPISATSTAYVAPAAYPQYMASPYTDPPNLHWALVLVIGLFTCGLFLTVWDIVQAAWMRKVNPRSNALFLYLGELLLSLFGGFARFGALMMYHYQPRFVFGVPVFLITLTLLELARFDMRRSMEEHFNGPDPVGLTLSGVMTFFFGSLYFQYHFTRINDLKRMARYRGMAI